MITNARNTRSRGFSLVELIIAMALGLLVLTGLSSTFVMQNHTYDTQDQINQMTQTTRAALDLISREVRMAGYDPAGIGFDGIVYNTDELKIYADLNGDGDTGDARELIKYKFPAGQRTIYRDESGYWQSMADNVESFTWEFLDANGNATTTSADIRRVRLTIRTRTEKPDMNYSQNGGYRTTTLRTLVVPPNLAS